MRDISKPDQARAWCFGVSRLFPGWGVLALLGGMLLSWPALASVIFTEEGTPPPGIFYLGFAGLTPAPVCMTNDPACPAPGSWTLEGLPQLAPPGSTSFTTSSGALAVDLGAALSGSFLVSVSPSFPIGSGTSELRVEIADTYAVRFTGSQGSLTFDAAPGTHYYMDVTGLVRPGVDYQLSISAAVPEPATFVLLLMGTLVVAARARRLHVPLSTPFCRRTVPRPS
jgi:hypothetical protein